VCVKTSMTAVLLHVSENIIHGITTGKHGILLQYILVLLIVL